MIPDIGILMGTYIITRMVEVVLPKRKDGTENVVSQLLALITILVAVFVMLDLFMKGSVGGMPRF